MIGEKAARRLSVFPEFIVLLLLCVAALMFVASRSPESKQTTIARSSQPSSRVPDEVRHPTELAAPPHVVAEYVTSPRLIRKAMLERDFAESVASVGPHSGAVERATAANIISVCAVVGSLRSSAVLLLDEVARIATRCESLFRPGERRDLLQRAAALHAASVDDSPAGRIFSLARQAVTDDRIRLRDEQLRELSSALASRDPVLVEPAVFALRVQVADASPDAELRSQALLQASREFAPADTTDFDLVATCISRGQCRSGDTAIEAHRTMREQAEFSRLVDAYRTALERNASAVEILAVR